jgi:hypothetical protein
VNSENVEDDQTRKIIEITPAYDEFKFELNNRLYQDNIEFDKEV